jgi:hypothetical protein
LADGHAVSPGSEWRKDPVVLEEFGGEIPAGALCSGCYDRGKAARSRSIRESGPPPPFAGLDPAVKEHERLRRAARWDRVKAAAHPMADCGLRTGPRESVPLGDVGDLDASISIEELSRLVCAGSVCPTCDRHGMALSSVPHPKAHGSVTLALACAHRGCKGTDRYTASPRVESLVKGFDLNTLQRLMVPCLDGMTFETYARSKMFDKEWGVGKEAYAKYGQVILEMTVDVATEVMKKNTARAIAWAEKTGGALIASVDGNWATPGFRSYFGSVFVLIFLGPDDNDPQVCHLETRQQSHVVNGKSIGTCDHHSSSGAMEGAMFRSLVATLNALGALRYMVKSRGGGWVLDLDSKGERALRRGWADTGMDPGEFSVSIDPGHGRKSFYKSMIKLFRTLKKYLF